MSDIPQQTPPILDMAVAFGRVLRRAGLAVGPGRVVEFTKALEELDVTRRGDVYWAGRVTLCSRPEHLEIYDHAFEAFWEGGEPPKRLTPKRTGFSIRPADDSVQPPKRSVERSGRGEEAVALHYSPVDVLKK